jgi:hypothetical protein
MTMGVLLLSPVRVFAAVEKSDAGYCGTKTFFNWGCSGDGIMGLLMTIFNWLAIGVTLVVIGGIIYGAITYTSSGGNPEQAKRGIGIIRNAIIALLMYFAMWSLLNFLVPGGVFT